MGKFRIEYIAEGIDEVKYTDSKLEANVICLSLLKQGYEPVIYVDEL